MRQAAEEATKKAKNSPMEDVMEDVAASVGEVAASVGKVFGGSESKSPLDAARHQWWKKKK
jgi:hypothetical protein